MSDTHRVFKESREKHWTDNKSEYYGYLIKQVMGDGITVNVATSSINIRAENGWDRGVNKRIIELRSEEKARAFLIMLRSINNTELDTIKKMEFSFDS